MLHVWAPPLMEVLCLQCFELSNAFERHTQFLITEASEGLNKAQAILKKKLPALQSSVQICSKAAPQMQPHTLWAKGLQMTVSYMYIFTIHVQHLHYISLCGSRSVVHLFITQITEPELTNPAYTVWYSRHHYSTSFSHSVADYSLLLPWIVFFLASQKF